MPKKVKKIETDETEEIEEETEEIIDDIDDIKIDETEHIKEDETEPEKEGDKEDELEKEEIKEDEIKDDDDEYNCMYKFTKKKKDETEELDFEQELKFDDDENIHSDIVEPEQRKTKRKLFNYEKVRILSTRAKQLSLGAKPLIKNAIGLDPKEIAKLELKNGVLPYIIERILPNGFKERWKISELI